MPGKPTREIENELRVTSVEGLVLVSCMCLNAIYYGMFDGVVGTTMKL